ncbi:MAG: hypothetical protein R3E47_03545 [Paracoccaceae bacterium]
MRRILIVGNSHVGAIKLGWEAAPRDDVDVRFFAAPQRTFISLRLSDELQLALPDEIKDRPRLPHRKILTELNGTNSANLAEFDEVMLVGWPSGADQLAALAVSCRLDASNTSQPRNTLLSTPARKAILERLAQSLRPAAEFEKIDSPRLYLLPRPTLAETALASDYWAYRNWRTLQREEASLLSLIEEFDGIRREDLGSVGISYLGQPPETRIQLGGTAAQFLAPDAGYIDPKKPSLRGDHIHMNATYGRICLDRFWQALGLEGEYAPVA